MTAIITRMPSTGRVTNYTESPDPISVVRARWADCPHVEVVDAAEVTRCPTCGQLACLRLCEDCR